MRAIVQTLWGIFSNDGYGDDLAYVFETKNLAEECWARFAPIDRGHCSIKPVKGCATRDGVYIIPDNAPLWKLNDDPYIRQNLKEQALNRLTQEERVALGVK